MRVLLIRHGETDLGAARVIQLPGTPLSARGLEQARRLARRLAKEGVGRVIASDLARAEMTARAVCEATGLPLELDPLLQERNFGDLRGTPYAELRSDPFAPGYTPPGGESWQVFHARVDRAWERIRALAAASEGVLAVVTHGLVCHSVVSRHVLPLDGVERPAPDRPSAIPNTAVSVLAGPDPWRLELHCCTAHLAEADALARSGAI